MSRVRIAAESLAAEGPTESRAERAERRPRAIRRKTGWSDGRARAEPRGRGMPGSLRAVQTHLGTTRVRCVASVRAGDGHSGWPRSAAAESALARKTVVPLRASRDCSARLATGEMTSWSRWTADWKRSRTDWTVLRAMTGVG